MARTAVVAGATGLVGGHLVRALCDDAAYEKVVALVRRPLAFAHQKLESRIVDFDRLAEVDVDATDAFSALGTTIKKAGSKDAFKKVDLEYVAAFAAAAKRSATTFIHVSSHGADARSVVFYNSVKGKAEAAVSALGFRTCVAMRPSLLVGERDEERFGEQVVAPLLGALGALPFAFARRIRPIEAADVARAMIAIAKQDKPGDRVVASEEIQRIADASR